jgi:hypothetical protein
MIRHSWAKLGPHFFLNLDARHMSPMSHLILNGTR